MKNLFLILLIGLGIQTTSAGCEGFCGEEYKMKLMEEMYESASEPTSDQLQGTWMFAESITQYFKHRATGREYSSNDSDDASSVHWRLHFFRNGKVDFYTGEQSLSVRGFYNYASYSSDKNDSAKINFDGKSACFYNKYDAMAVLGRISEDIRTCRSIAPNRIICKSVRITNGVRSSVGYVGWIKH
ncbi:MAG: hypothetical protein CME62_07990 [Halobacteriovoraceae bacterium]|nr:hypothetical protein [Halobacteriovoraceae bacterium]|tara:strand:- start:5494 stop:6051 length:558 start_codon:yes stop_codon:yes gene_type:complete